MSRRVSASVVACAAMSALVAAPATALPTRNFGPANPTTIGAACANPGDTGQTVERVRTYFDGSAGAWTIANYNSEPLPITRTITETKTKTWNISASINFDIVKLVNVSFGASYTDTQSYQVGDTVGPYPLAPGKTAVMRAGWVVSDFRGEKTVCGQDGTWQGTGQTFTATLPAERHVEVSARDNIQFN
ncbi:hypothetical protein G7Y31_05675 [Corynebacterium lizhenjunii]|uniref:Secreted protein n=2 Tax=Corynebacterium lizhenjunii TaxID=2709394 RepID=A0A7T0PD17_9CORY|nr:hypothetical protein G7Y31_05675 [Corynebacterium lizhenjunii]